MYCIVIIRTTEEDANGVWSGIDVVSTGRLLVSLPSCSMSLRSMSVMEKWFLMIYWSCGNILQKKDDEVAE